MTAKVASLLVACALVTAPTLGIDPLKPEGRRELLDDATLRCVYFVDSSQGWAVGDRGVIWYTPDGGEHWLAQNSTVACQLNCVRFVNHQEGIVVGGWTEPDTQISRGVVLRTEDGGQTWTRLETDVPHLTSVHMHAPDEATATGAWSEVYLNSQFITYDGGHNWQPAPQSHGSQSHALHVVEPAVITMADSGVLCYAAHAADHRTPVYSDPLLTTIGGSGGDLVAVGHNGHGALSRDGGRTWRPMHLQASTVAIEKYDLKCLATQDDMFWTAGIPGDRIFIGKADGKLVPAATGSHVPLHDIQFIDADHGWAVGAMGTILHTFDGGKHCPGRSSHKNRWSRGCA